jgi:hypothetical protein
MTKDKIKSFNLDYSYDYYNQVNLNKKNKIKTWAVFWYANCFLNNGLSLHPKRSYCMNIGHDGTGTNCGVDTVFNVILNDHVEDIINIDIVEHSIARKKLIDYFEKTKPKLKDKILNKIKKIGMK